MTIEDVERLALKLCEQDRCELIRRLCWSLDPQDSDARKFVLTPELAAELERRVADFERNPDQGRPWRDVFAELSAKLSCSK